MDLPDACYTEKILAGPNARAVDGGRYIQHMLRTSLSVPLHLYTTYIYILDRARHASDTSTKPIHCRHKCPIHAGRRYFMLGGCFRGRSCPLSYNLALMATPGCEPSWDHSGSVQRIELASGDRLAHYVGFGDSNLVTDLSINHAQTSA